MNILFLLKTIDTGGLEVVTSVLANKFAKEGHRVWVFAFLDGKNSIAGRLDASIGLVMGEGYAPNRGNVDKLRQMLVENSVDVIINQWGLPLTPIRTARRAAKGLKVKIVSVYHNAPSFNGRIQGVCIKLDTCENSFRRLLLKALREAYRAVTSCAMRYVYEKSDLFLVLSEGYRKEFQEFTGVKNLGKLGVMPNPVTVDTENFRYDAQGKHPEIIYVGRLDFVQKRVYRIINIWNYLEEQFPGWHLTIVGDGEDRANLERHTNALGLKRVFFEGFKAPMDYYRRASILMLTSDFEGFPLVLAECMSFGVVPMVYHSFAAVEDVLDDGCNSLVIPYSASHFPTQEVARRLSALMKDPDRLNTMAEVAMCKSRQFGIEGIYGKWMEVLSKVCHEPSRM